jgi:hypothetical protein
MDSMEWSGSVPAVVFKEPCRMLKKSPDPKTDLHTSFGIYAGLPFYDAQFQITHCYESITVPTSSIRTRLDADMQHHEMQKKRKYPFDQDDSMSDSEMDIKISRGEMQPE